MLASAFEEFATRDETTIFASGVSNSLEKDQAAFSREEALLNAVLENYPASRLVYFSTYSIIYKKSPYTEHKQRMEKLVLTNNPNALVLRVTNVVGKSKNPNTLLNFLSARISQKIPVTIQQGVKRNPVCLLYTSRCV